MKGFDPKVDGDLLGCLPRAARFIRRALRGRLLVHCTRGISRSCSVVLGAGHGGP